MKILEIDDHDKLWASITEIDLNIDEYLKVAINIIESIKKEKSVKRKEIWIQKLNQIIETLNMILNQPMADDVETNNLKKKCINYLNRIQQLSSDI